MAHLRGKERARYVARMFARISRRYDLLNTVMSGGRHYAWRHAATDMAVKDLSGWALDVACGTGDFTFDLARKTTVTGVVGVDFTGEMLSLARRKARRHGLSARVSFVAGDAHALPFPDNQFICATVGFGLRNFIDVPHAIREMSRVVRPGGRVVLLEIVPMDGWGPLRWLFPFFFRHVTPWVGALLAGDREAYTYLPESVQVFHSSDDLATMMSEAGLVDVAYRKLALGAVAIHVGEKHP